MVTVADAELLCAAALLVTRYLIRRRTPYRTQTATPRCRGDLGVDVRLKAHDTESVMASLADTVQQLRNTVLNVRDNADSVAQANQLAQGASDVAGHGGSTMKHIVEAIAKLTDVIGETSSASREQTASQSRRCNMALELDTH